MKLKRLMIIEIATIFIALFLVIFLVEVSPLLASSNPDSSISTYKQKLFAEGTATLTPGQRATARALTTFSYSNYDPAIIVLDILFLSWQNPGNISIYCNDRYLATIYATPEKPKMTLNVFSLSGLDWVESPTLTTSSAINRVVFASEVGYEGSFSYSLYIRGSR